MFGVADERNNQCYYSSNIDCKKMLLVCVKKDKKYNKQNKKIESLVIVEE